MSVELAPVKENIISITVHGKLHKSDYETFVPQMERLITEHGKVRMLIELRDFHGWEAGALWKDIKFDAKHFNDIERLAIVGETAWQKGMAVFCKPFTTATIRYFDTSKIDEARMWLAMSPEEEGGAASRT